MRRKSQLDFYLEFHNYTIRQELIIDKALRIVFIKLINNQLLLSGKRLFTQ